MYAVRMTAEWLAWMAALSAPLDGRLRPKLATIVVGILFASGRRTATSWWRAAGVGSNFRSYYYFLDALGRKVSDCAAALLRIALERLETGDRLTFAIDDTPTKRFGPKVQGAGLHHNPTPGPAGTKYLYGHNWVVISWIVRHERFGILGLPLLGLLYVRKKDIQKLPEATQVVFQTKLDQAVRLIVWLRGAIAKTPPLWGVVDGFYAKKEVLHQAREAGVVIVSRLRKDAAIYDLPPVLKPGQKRGRGRPALYGKNRLSLAKRAGQRRGWTALEVRTCTGRLATKRVKTFLATWRPVGGVIRVVLVEEEDRTWRALFCTDPDASVADIVQTAMDRWGIEQNFHDLKETEGIAQVQLRRYFANVGALNLNLWVHTMIELWGWGRDASGLSDRSGSPWDDATRRPSHTDRRKSLQREMLREEFQAIGLPQPWREKIRQFLSGIVNLAG